MGAALLFLAFIAGTASFVLLHQISNKTSEQIELDQLTGTIAIQLRASAITIENSKERLQLAHALMLAGCLFPPDCLAFTEAYQLQEKVENEIQLMAKVNWKMQEIKWLGFKPLLAKKGPLISMDALERKKEAEIQIQLGSLRSTSRVWKTKEPLSNGWKIAWIE